jgi:hypothetical protein
VQIGRRARWRRMALGLAYQEACHLRLSLGLGWNPALAIASAKASGLTGTQQFSAWRASNWRVE